MEIQPYLFFYGRCEEAVEFYRKAIGADSVELMRFREAPEPMPPGMLPPGFENKIMHGMFKVGPTTVLVSDGNRAQGDGYKGFSVALQVASEREAERVFKRLADGGKVGMPLAKTFWSPRFGSVTDRFGIEWMVNTTTEDMR